MVIETYIQNGKIVMPNTSNTLDSCTPITPLDSGTIRAALKAIAVNVFALTAVFTGKHYNVDTINMAIDSGVPMLVNGLSIYWGLKAIKSRMNATQTIKKG